MYLLIYGWWHVIVSQNSSKLLPIISNSFGVRFLLLDQEKDGQEKESQDNQKKEPKARRRPRGSRLASEKSKFTMA